MTPKQLKLLDLASVIRSKNAGPFLLTLDIFFADQASLASVLRAGALSPHRVGAIYGVDPAAVRVVDFPIVRAIKITMPRRCGSGDPSDSDIYAAQQYIPLLDVDIQEP